MMENELVPGVPRPEIALQCDQDNAIGGQDASPQININLNNNVDTMHDVLRRDKKCTEKYTGWIILIVIIVFCSIVALCLSLAPGKDVTERIDCYECFFANNKTMYNNVPFEANCAEFPSNNRQCDIGENCLSARVRENGSEVYFRKCQASKDRLGCIKLTPPKQGHVCICETSLCLS